MARHGGRGRGGGQDTKASGLEWVPNCSTRPTAGRRRTRGRSCPCTARPGRSPASDASRRTGSVSSTPGGRPVAGSSTPRRLRRRRERVASIGDLAADARDGRDEVVLLTKAGHPDDDWSSRVSPRSSRPTWREPGASRRPGRSTSSSSTATAATCRSARSSRPSPPRSRPGGRGRIGVSNWTLPRLDAALPMSTSTACHRSPGAAPSSVSPQPDRRGVAGDGRRRRRRLARVVCDAPTRLRVVVADRERLLRGGRRPRPRRVRRLPLPGEPRPARPRGRARGRPRADDDPGRAGLGHRPAVPPRSRRSARGPSRTCARPSRRRRVRLTEAELALARAWRSDGRCRRRARPPPEAATWA